MKSQLETRAQLDAEQLERLLRLVGALQPKST
jgi:hypothetical protein